MSKDQRQGWIAELKAGDRVIVANYYNAHVRTVAKITPTGRISIGATVFRPDGREMGERSYHPYRLEQATPEAIKEITEDGEISKAISLMHRTTKLTYNQAVKILAALEEA